MYNISEQFINKTFNEYSSSLVGRLCKNIEALQKDLDKDSIEYRYLSHVKELHREKIYETFRDLKNHFKAHNSGLKFRKFNIAPSTNSKELS